MGAVEESSVTRTRELFVCSEGPFAGKPFYVDTVFDALNRSQFRIVTWHGPSTEDGYGGWWHLDSITHDFTDIVVYTEVAFGSAEEFATYPFSNLGDDEAAERMEDLLEESSAWARVATELAVPFGLRKIEPDEASDTACAEFREGLEQIRDS